MQEVKLNVELGLYPPMFKLQICPKNMLTQCYDCLDICVQFQGIRNFPPNCGFVVDRILILMSKSLAFVKYYNGVYIVYIMYIAGAGAISEGRAAIVARNTPQQQALDSHLPTIIALISHDVINVASIMFKYQLIPKQLYTKIVNFNGITDYVKTTELMTAVSAQITIDQNTFQEFLEVLKEARDYTKHLIEILHSKHACYLPVYTY